MEILQKVAYYLGVVVEIRSVRIRRNVLQFLFLLMLVVETI